MNHPYFKHPYFTNRTPINHYEANPPIESENSISTPYSDEVMHYTPKVVDGMLTNPVWNETSPNHCEVISGLFNKMHPIDGYRVDKDCKIVSDPSSIYNGYISAMGVVIGADGNKTYPTHIVNTEDAGLRMVSFDAGGYDPLDIGPVEDVMIIGNHARPEGIYVPLCNMKAIADAAVVIDKELKKYEQSLNDNMLAANDTKLIEEAHECKCGGNCQCGGNCKCHHD